MPIALEIALPDPLPMVRLALVHPALAPIRQRAPRARPVEILSLPGPLGAGTVLQTRVPGGEVVGPLFGRGGEARVPD